MTLAQQRRYEIFAFNLLIIGMIESALINYYYKKSFWDPHTKHSTYLAALVVLPFFIWQFYGIRQGKRWAKLSYIVLTVIGWVFLALDYKRMVPKLFTPMPFALNTIVQYALTAVVIVLLLLSLRKPILEPLLATSE
jgi:asparagine N-glycosylation enzyme membrane subunit Stt3